MTESSAVQSGHPNVSAVIPAYNAADTIERALDSVYAQTYENIIEVIVVDDGSTDDTAAVVRSNYPTAVVIEQCNSGVAAARNAGADIASGDFIAFLDADDEWLPKKVAVHVHMMRRHPGFSLTTSQYLEGSCAAPKGLQGAIIRQLPFMVWIRGQEWQHGTTSCCSGWVVRRDMFSTLGGFDHSIRSSEDLEFLLRMTGRGFAVATILRPLYRYYRHSDSTSNSPEGRLANSSRIPEVKSRFNPENDDWQGELLTQQEYAEIVMDTHFRVAWALWDSGLYQEAGNQLKMSREAARFARSISWRHYAASIAPALYRWLSKVRS